MPIVLIIRRREQMPIDEYEIRQLIQLNRLYNKGIIACLVMVGISCILTILAC